jgi:peptide/nickel transport system ATP-binding protein
MSPDPAAALLSVTGLEVRAVAAGTSQTLVDGISFEVRPDETVGMVGESGSGKSLTARAILGLLPRNLHASGSIKFRGRELLTASERQLSRIRGTGISLVLQDPFTMLSPTRRTRAHVEEMLRAADGRRLSRRARRAEADRRLGEVGISADMGRRYPFQVSGGMAQRIGLAAALAGDPELLIADEPSTALDVTTQREILDLLRQTQQRRHMGLLLITHDLRVAFSVCDRVHVFYAGRLLEVAKSWELMNRPLHPYTYRLLQAEPDVRQRKTVLAAIAGKVPRPADVANMCAFAPRCPWAEDKCRESRPPAVEIEPGRLTACMRIGEIESDFRAPVTAPGGGPSAPAAAVPEEPVLSVRGLAKSFAKGREEISVLTDVSIDVGQGESVGLVGESGAGKTTLARCIIGLEQATTGEITIGGVDASDFAAIPADKRQQVRRIVQMVFQNPYASLNPARTIGATLSEALTVAAPSPERPSVASLLERVGLPSAYARRKPAGMSGGERQRVAIARALAVSPRLLVCDESVSALDVSVQAQILNLFRDLQRDLDLAFLFITHDLGVVRQVTDRIYILNAGRIVEAGDTASILDSPGHPYTQRLLDSVPQPSPLDTGP